MKFFKYINFLCLKTEETRTFEQEDIKIVFISTINELLCEMDFYLDVVVFIVWKHDWEMILILVNNVMFM